MVQYNLLNDAEVEKIEIWEDTTKYKTLGFMQLTPDDRIFINRTSNCHWKAPNGFPGCGGLFVDTLNVFDTLNDCIAIIHNPDVKGLGCNFDTCGIDFRDYPPLGNSISLPHYPNYRLGPLKAPTGSAGQDQTICFGDSTSLGVPPQHPFSFSWSPAQALSCTDCANPIAFPATTTEYVVTITSECTEPVLDTVLVTVLPADSCVEDSDTVIIPPPPPPIPDTLVLLLPNAFSPNGDSFNDSFGPITNLPYRMLVFNRWGDLIYSGNGNWIPDVDVPEGVYTYQIAVELDAARTIYRTGTVTLVR